MSLSQVLILAVLLATVGMFLWGRWRHDMVAVGALLACVFVGLVPFDQAFAGFSHPAVITVACVLVLSRALQESGAVDVLARRMLPANSGPTVSIAALATLAAILSGFMNNVGALALLMPVALQIAVKQGLPPGKVLMPLAFGSILGGMTTLIGTPPNLIVAGFRAEQSGTSFGMFDFTPVGLGVAAVGLMFVALVGWRLVPARKRADSESFETGAYLTEARVPKDSKAVGLRMRQAEAELEDSGAQIVGLVRNEVHVNAPHPGRLIRSGDILVIEAEADTLASALSSLGLKLEEARPTASPPKTDDETEAASDNEAVAMDAPSDELDNIPAGAAAEAVEQEKQDDHAGETPSRASDEVALAELAILPGSALVRRSASDLLLRTRYGINLLAVSRQGTRSTSRLRTLSLEAGDVLLMQGPPEAMQEFSNNHGCVPLAERALRIPDTRKAWLSGLIMALAIGGAALGLLPAAVSFAGGVLASMALRTVQPRSVYDAIDWSVIVLLAALIPVAAAMETSGAADLIARVLLNNLAQGNALLALVLVLVVTMTLSDLMNNAATAAVMCPIAIGTATQLGVNPDAFLMAVAIGASCAFLTPIGHQNNTLILGPGGFHFGDYWRLGLPLELLVIAVAVPLLLWVWPL